MESIKIHHFGPVKDIDIELQRLTVFIGTQGCGKSTISKLLTICRDMNWCLSLVNQSDNPLTPFGKFCIDRFFYEDTYIRYEGTFDIGHYVITYSDGKFSINPIGQSQEDFILKIKDSLLKANSSLLSQLGVTNLDDPEIMRKYEKIISSNSRFILYVPAERNLAGTLSTSLASIITAQVPLYDALVEYMSVFEKAKNALNDYSVPFLNAKFTKRNGEERVSLSDTIDGQERLLPLQDCSSGIQSVLPLIMVLDYALQVGCFNAFVIEEPEQNLYPTNQRELLQFLLSRSKKLERAIITTHSPYILSCLNVMILAGRIAGEFDDGYAALQKVYEGLMLESKYVAVYSLDPERDEYCQDLKDSQTGLIGVNGLDAVSDIIGEEFDKLYRLYIKLKRG